MRVEAMDGTSEPQKLQLRRELSVGHCTFETTITVSVTSFLQPISWLAVSAPSSLHSAYKEKFRVPEMVAERPSDLALFCFRAVNMLADSSTIKIRQLHTPLVAALLKRATVQRRAWRYQTRLRTGRNRSRADSYPRDDVRPGWPPDGLQEFTVSYVLA